MLIQLRNISHRYPKSETNVISDVSLTLRYGQTMAIVAPSGFGKSTLLGIAGLLLQPTTGEVLLEGREVSVKHRSMLLGQNGISWVLQSPTLFPGRTALDNVIVGNLVSGARREEYTAEAEHVLEQVGLGHRIDARSRDLSGGEKQRVAVARAIFSKPKLIIADEPTANLDRQTADHIAESIFSIGHDSAVLVATHDPIVADMADIVLEPTPHGSFHIR